MNYARTKWFRNLYFILMYRREYDALKNPWGRRYKSEVQGLFITVFKVRESGILNCKKNMITMRYFEQNYLRELLKAMYEDGCRIIGYTAWSLIDNFQWDEGYE